MPRGYLGVLVRKGNVISAPILTLILTTKGTDVSGLRIIFILLKKKTLLIKNDCLTPLMGFSPVVLTKSGL